MQPYIYYVMERDDDPYAGYKVVSSYKDPEKADEQAKRINSASGDECLVVGVLHTYPARNGDN